MPVLSAAGLPPLGCRTTPDAGQRASALDDVGGAVGRAVVDDDDLDRRGWSLATSERTVAAMPAFSLYAGTITDTGR